MYQKKKLNNFWSPHKFLFIYVGFFFDCSVCDMCEIKIKGKLKTCTFKNKQTSKRKILKQIFYYYKTIQETLSVCSLFE